MSLDDKLLRRDYEGKLFRFLNDYFKGRAGKQTRRVKTFRKDYESYIKSNYGEVNARIGFTFLINKLIEEKAKWLEFEDERKNNVIIYPDKFRNYYKSWD